jgi:hypothetical protein
MPLVKSASSRARRENTAREIDAGKPVKQAVAIGYAMQRRAGGKNSKLDHDKVSKWAKGDRKNYDG